MSEDIAQTQAGGVAVAATPEKEKEYAGFWIRVGARIIDFIILAIVTFFIGFIIGFVMGITSPDLADKRAIVDEATEASVAQSLEGVPEDELFSATFSATLGSVNQVLECDYDSAEVVEACEDVRSFDNTLAAVGVIVNVIAYIGYFVVATASSMQGSLGKKLLKLKVVNERDEKISYSQSFTREVFYLGMYLFQFLGVFVALLGSIASLFNLGFIISSIVVAFDKKKQGLHDKLAKTYVIRAE